MERREAEQLRRVRRDARLLGDRPEARRLYEELSDDPDDIFAALAGLVWLQWHGDPAQALARAATLQTSLPRFDVIVGVLETAAQIQLGQDSLAVSRLRRLWRQHPAPRLLRFALRLVPAPVADTIVGYAAELPQDMAEALSTMADDPRPSRWQVRPQLTPTEREVLLLMADGLTNQQVADARFVSLNTLRSQLKALYRKLDVANRREALAVASEWHLLE